MTFLKKERKELCPLCYLEHGKDVAMQYTPGGAAFYNCPEGHEYKDREALGLLVAEANQKKRGGQAAVAPTPKPIDPKVEEKGDVTVVESEPSEGTEKEPKEKRVAVDQTDRSIKVNPVDFARLTGILGHFTDSSSLFGAVWALNQQMLDAKELLKRAMDAKKVSETSNVRKVGGDAMIQVVIPERHVMPIEDVAKANNMDITRYMNARIEDGLDNMWFY